MQKHTPFDRQTSIAAPFYESADRFPDDHIVVTGIDSLDSIEMAPGLKIAGGIVVEVTGISLVDVIDDEFDGKTLDKTTAGIAMSTAKGVVIQLSGGNAIFDFDYQKVYKGDDYIGRVLRYSAKVGDISDDEVKGAGVSVEFAGPTERMEQWNILPNFTPDITTNIELDGEKGELIDAQADVSKMPLADLSVGSVHVSCLPGGDRSIVFGSPLRSSAIAEASRVVKEGGFIVWDAATPKDHQAIIDAGFTPRKTMYTIEMYEKADSTYKPPGITICGVYQKMSSSDSLNALHT